MEDYEKMLTRARMLLPKKVLEKRRFEMPKADSIIQGNRTIFRNFSEIAKIIRRDEKHFFKFITKELAVAGSIEGGRLILNGKFTNYQIQKVVESYINTYVLCPECKRPDTHFIEEHGIKMLKCEACGAISPIKKL